MLKNMKIAQRLIITFVIVAALASISGILGITLLKQSDKDYSNALVTYGFAQGDLGNLGRHFQKQRSSVLYVLTAPNDMDRAAYLAELADVDKLIDSDMKIVEDSLVSELGRQVFSELNTALVTYRADRDKSIKANETIKGDAIIALYRQNCGTSSTAFSDIIDRMLLDKTNIGTDESIKLSNQTKLFTGIMIGVSTISILIALALGLIISRGISKPITQMEAAAKEIAKGNYDIDVDFASRDEIGQLAGSMRTMISTTKDIIQDTDRALHEISVGNFNLKSQTEYIGIFKRIQSSIDSIVDKLSQTMAQIQQASEQVSGGSAQVSSGAQALSQGTTEQASSVQELAATITEISEQVKRNAGNAQAASQKVGTVSVEITESNRQMQNLIAAMSEITSSSNEIGKVIKTIEDIAFQTNILALNAAVEAARAGAAGKGFAVVADEVRNLATKSSEAAKGTTVLIEGSIKAVENGTKIADETAKSLMLVVDGAKEVSTLVDRISEASKSQADSISQVTLGVDQISAVVQTNSATAEESAASSEELSGQAQIMRDLVSKFQLKGGTKISIDLSYHDDSSPSSFQTDYMNNKY